MDARLRMPLFLCALLPALAAAQDTRPPQTSVEQGQTPLDESFGTRTHDEWVRETRRKAFADTVWKVQLRTYDLDRDNFDDSKNAAWALGGSAGFKTGYFRERVSFGATLYTSQKLYGPENEDGTQLLATGQRSYTMLGEAYAEVLLGSDVKATLGARGFDTPYLNRNDSRMSPNTFLGAAVQALHRDADAAEWRWGGGWFDSMKPRNENQFIAMSEVAGASVDRGVAVAGLNYERGVFSLGAIDYWSDDILNIFHTEAKYGLHVDDGLQLRFGLQYSDQRSVGEDLLTGAPFSTSQWGAKTDLALGPALLTFAYTSTGDGANMRSPWSHYPGYTASQMESFNRAGEDAWMLRAGYEVQRVKDLSFYALYVAGNTPVSGDAQGETDFNIQWSPREGKFKGLMLRLRYAHVARDDPDDTQAHELRLMMFYDLPL